jgi:hypothetical protein
MDFRRRDGVNAPDWHGAAFLAQLENRAELVQKQFEAIDVIGFRLTYGECMLKAREILEPILADDSTEVDHGRRPAPG